MRSARAAVTSFVFPALLSLAAASPAQIQAQPNVVNTGIRSTIDAVGNGEITITLKMNAKEWAGWKRQYGANPSLFKRDVCKMFTQYELTDFELDQDEMDREARVTIRAKGLSTYEGRGRHEVELGKGGMAKGELVDGEYRVTYTEPQGPNTVSLVDQRVQLPPGAHGAEVATNASGVPVLRYQLAPAGAGLPWLWIGTGLAVAAAGLLFASTRVQKPHLAAVTQAIKPGSLAS